MNPGEVRKLLGGYAAGTLTEEERRALFEAALTDQELFNELGREQALKELLDEPNSRRQLLAALDAKESWIERIRGWLGRPVAWVAVGSLAVAAVLVVVVVQRAQKPAAVLVARQEVPAGLEMRSVPPAATPVPSKPAEQAQALKQEPLAKETASDRAEPPAQAPVPEDKAKAEVERSDRAMARAALPAAGAGPQVGGSAGGRGGGGGSAAAPAPAEPKPLALSAMRAAPVPQPSPAKPQPSSTVEVVPAAPPPRVTEQITVTAEATKLDAETGRAAGAADLQSALGVRKDASQAMFLRSAENSLAVSAAAQMEQARAAGRLLVPYRILRADAKGTYIEVPDQTVFRAADRVRVLFTAAREGHLTITAAGRSKPLLDRDVKTGASNRIDVPSGVQNLGVTFTPRVSKQPAAAPVATPPTGTISFEVPIPREPAPR